MLIGSKNFKKSFFYASSIEKLSVFLCLFNRRVVSFLLCKDRMPIFRANLIKQNFILIVGFSNWPHTWNGKKCHYRHQYFQIYLVVRTQDDCLEKCERHAMKLFIDRKRLQPPIIKFENSHINPAFKQVVSWPPQKSN